MKQKVTDHYITVFSILGDVTAKTLDPENGYKVLLDTKKN